MNPNICKDLVIFYEDQQEKEYFSSSIHIKNYSKYESKHLQRFGDFL